VAEIKCLENLKHVEPDVEVVETLVKLTEISVTSIDKFSDDGWSFGQRVARDAEHIDDVGPTLQRLQNLKLTPNLVFLDYNRKIVRSDAITAGKCKKIEIFGELTRLQDLDYDSLIVHSVDAFIDLRILASANLLDDLKVVLGLELDFIIFVVRVVWDGLSHLCAHIGVVLGRHLDLN